jgi:CP family cyanate transporter-like MFS transporter
LIGVWVGVTFPSLMTMPLDVGASPGEVAAFASMMLGVGYAISSMFPFLFGAVRDSTGSFTAVLWLVVATAGLLALASLGAPHRRREAPGRTEAVPNASTRSEVAL